MPGISVCMGVVGNEPEGGARLEKERKSQECGLQPLGSRAKEFLRWGADMIKGCLQKNQ